MEMEQKIENRTIDEIYASRRHIETTKNGENDEIKGLIVKRINDAYSWGVYGQFKLIIRDADGYVNGTHLIHEAMEYDNVKRRESKLKLLTIPDFYNWIRNDSTILLIDELNQDPRIRGYCFIDPVKGKQRVGEEMIRGTYIHPRLVNSLATWVSPSYALRVGDLMNDFHVKNKLSAERKHIRDLETDLSKKDDVIADLRDMYNSISEKFQVTVDQNKILITELKINGSKLDRANSSLKKNTHKLNKTQKSLDKNTQKLNETRETLKKNTQKLERTNDFLKFIAPDIRIQTYPGNEHLFVICKLNSDKKTAFTYKSIRVLKNDLEKRVVAIRKDFPDAEIICKFHTPNPVQLWKQLKREKKNQITSDGVYFDYAGQEFELISVAQELVDRLMNEVKNITDN